MIEKRMIARLPPCDCPLQVRLYQISETFDSVIKQLRTAQNAGNSPNLWLRNACQPRAWSGETIDDVEIGMPVQVVPRIFEEVEDIRVYYTVERPDTTWGKAPAPGSR